MALSLLLFSLSFFLFNIYIGWIRNHEVRDYRLAVGDYIFGQGRDDRRITELLKIYDSVSYDKMIWKFWKPVDSFYPKGTFSIEL